MWLSQLQAILIASVLFYLCLVKWFRFHRSKTMPSRLGYTDRTAFSRMTTEDAWKIHNFLIDIEFPTTFSTATTFALFKTYGIPTISSLLCATGQYSSIDNVDKRSSDTGCLLLEAVLNPPASPRAIEAIARINYLHSSYQKIGKITDADMLYTLSLFALEPSRWVTEYEWRELTSLERCAVGTIWKQLGDRLGVKYDVLPGSQEGWRDGIEWLEQLETWSREYQDAHMVPALTNQKVADATIYHIVWSLPVRLRPMGRKIVAAILGDKLREAMMIPKPPQSYLTFVRRFKAIRKFTLLHLALPRIWPPKRIPIASSTGRLHARGYIMQPWYVKPTIVNRYGPAAWMTWLKGGVVPGDQGEKYFPQGFVASELGPTALRKLGKEKMEMERQKLEAEWVSETGKCPFFVRKME